jgi:hypothetical protein
MEAENMMDMERCLQLCDMAIKLRIRYLFGKFSTPKDMLNTILSNDADGMRDAAGELVGTFGMDTAEKLMEGAI